MNTENLINASEAIKSLGKWLKTQVELFEAFQKNPSSKNHIENEVKTNGKKNEFKELNGELVDLRKQLKKIKTEMLNSENKLKKPEDLASKIEKGEPKVPDSSAKTDLVTVNSAHVKTPPQIVKVYDYNNSISRHHMQIKAYPTKTDGGVEKIVLIVQSVSVEVSVKISKIGVKTETNGMVSNIQKSVQADLKDDLNSQKELSRKQTPMPDQNKIPITEPLTEVSVPDKKQKNDDRCRN